MIESAIFSECLSKKRVCLRDTFLDLFDRDGSTSHRKILRWAWTQEKYATNICPDWIASEEYKDETGHEEWTLGINRRLGWKLPNSAPHSSCTMVGPPYGSGNRHPHVTRNSPAMRTDISRDPFDRGDRVSKQPRCPSCPSCPRIAMMETLACTAAQALVVFLLWLSLIPIYLPGLPYLLGTTKRLLQNLV